MAGNPIPPMPIKSKLVDSNGFISIPWQFFFQELWNRAGGSVADSNTTLLTAIQSVQTTQAADELSIAGLSQGRAL